VNDDVARDAARKIAEIRIIGAPIFAKKNQLSLENHFPFGS
jgi:hypothetical protein